MAHPTQDGRQNKVYVNPNFHSEQKKVPAVHFNPAFSTKSRIFVNPNFVSRSNSIANYETATESIYATATKSVYTTTTKPFYGTDTKSVYATTTKPVYATTTTTVYETATTPVYATAIESNYATKDFVKTDITEPCCSKSSIVSQPLASKSRFSLTRHKKENLSTKDVQAYTLPNQHGIAANLIKSKYSIKRCTNDIPPKEPYTNSGQPRDIDKTPSLMPFTKTRFKLTRSQENVKTEFKIRRNSELVNEHKSIKQSRLKYSSPSNKTYTSIQSRYKNRAYVLKCNKKVEIPRRRSLSNFSCQTTVDQNPPISKMKKNNIPCPLFTKFGRCIRQDRGSCCFLHNRKHVRLCKKFLKGLCFNKNCLLSHALSTQKMPTCHFYLRGLCVKENCPYLHVKLNEDAKICKDFLKGYCEKGANCLSRHVDVKSSSYSTKRWTQKSDRKKTTKKEQNVTQAPLVKEKGDVAVKLPENERYYRDKVQEPTSTDVQQIKPSRCKLGLLPSFIKL